MAALLAVLAIGLFALTLATAFTTKERLFMAVIYILIACTFLNNAFFAIHLGFFSLFLYRLLLIAAGCLHVIGMVRNRTHIERWNGLQVKGILLFFAFWFIYGLVSLLWAKSVTAGIKYLALLAMGIFFIYLIVMYVQKMERLMIVYTIWLVMTLFLMIIGFYNHITHHHLPSSTLYSGPEYKQHYPTSVFFNQNDFATFLSISFFLHRFNEKHKEWIHQGDWPCAFALCVVFNFCYWFKSQPSGDFCRRCCLYLHCIAACSKENGHMAVSGGNCHFCSSIRQPNLFKVLGAVSGTADAAFISRQASIKCGPGQSAEKRMALFP